MNRSPEKLDRFIRKAGGSTNSSTLATPTKSNERPNDVAKEPAVEVAQLDVSSGSKQKKELSPWMRNGMEMLAPFQEKILKESKNKTHAFKKRIERLTQKYLRKVEEILKENKENDQTTRVVTGAAQATTTSPAPSSSSTLSSTPSTSSTSKTTPTLLNFFTHSQKETIVPKIVGTPGTSSSDPHRKPTEQKTASGPPSTSGTAKVELAKTPATPGKKVLPKIRMGGPPGTSDMEILDIPKTSMTPGRSGNAPISGPPGTSSSAIVAFPTTPMRGSPGKSTPRKSQPPQEQKSPGKMAERSSGSEFTPNKTAEATPSKKEVDKNDIITLDDSDDEIQLVDELPKREQRSDVPEKQEEPDDQQADVPELQDDADDEKEDVDDDGDDTMEGDSNQGDSMQGTTKKRKRQRKGDDLFIDMNDKMLVDVEDIEDGRKLTRAARRSGGLNSSNVSTDPHVAGHSDTAISPVKKRTKRTVTTSEDSEDGKKGGNEEMEGREESMETATEESMDEAEERLQKEVSHISLEDRREQVSSTVAEPLVDTRDRKPKPHHGRGDMVRWTCGGKNCTRAFGSHSQVYQHMLYDHPLRPDHSDIVGLCECGLFADFPDLIIHRQKGDKATWGAPHSTLSYWTYDEMEAEEMSVEEKERKEAFSDLAEELRRCMCRGCSNLGFLFDTFEEMEEHNAKQHNIKLLYTCRVDHPEEKSLITCLSAPLYLEHERKCKSFCFPTITKIFVDKKRAKKEAQEREAAASSTKGQIL